jgi:hypothetical protein
MEAFPYKSALGTSSKSLTTSLGVGYKKCDVSSRVHGYLLGRWRKDTLQPPIVPFSVYSVSAKSTSPGHFRYCSADPDLHSANYTSNSNVRLRDILCSRAEAASCSIHDDDTPVPSLWISVAIMAGPRASANFLNPLKSSDMLTSSYGNVGRG